MFAEEERAVGKSAGRVIFAGGGGKTDRIWPQERGKQEGVKR